MWYFIEDNQKRGSFSLEEMESFAHQGDINENTLVWKKGMKEWQPLSQTELKYILPDDTPPPIPSELPPPFPTTYRNVQKPRVEETIPPQSAISRDSRIKLLYAAKARIWVHWLFWLFIPYVGGIISVTKLRNWDGWDGKSWVYVHWAALMPIFISILTYVRLDLTLKDPDTAQIIGLNLFTLFCQISGAYKTQQIIQKARNQLNIKDPLQAEKQLLKHF
ncbi:MAG: DUF4339 domain-containing protein [Pseudanabaena sp. ELA645]|jgi:hypothetical protein